MMNYFRNTEEFHIDFMVGCFYGLCFGVRAWKAFWTQ